MGCFCVARNDALFIAILLSAYLYIGQHLFNIKTRFAKVNFDVKIYLASD